MYPGTFAQQTPDKPAIVMADTGERLTYRERDERSAKLAHVLRDAGLAKGDHIAFLAPNSPEVFVIYWAALRSGLYVTAINHHLASAEVGYIVDDCGAQALLVSAANRELAEAVVADTPKVHTRLGLRRRGRRLRVLRGCGERRVRRATGGPAARHRHAVLVGDDGQAQGCQAHAAGAAGR